MSDHQVLISEGRHATAFHRELGNSRLAACGKNAQHDQEFVRVSLQEAVEEYNRDPCPTCSFPDDWLGVDTGEEVAADGGETFPKLTVARDKTTVSALVDCGWFSVLATAEHDEIEAEDIRVALQEIERELRHLADLEPSDREKPSRRRVRTDGGDQL